MVCHIYGLCTKLYEAGTLNVYSHYVNVLLSHLGFALDLVVERLADIKLYIAEKQKIQSWVENPFD